MLLGTVVFAALLLALPTFAFPDNQAFARALEDEIYAKHMKEMGLERREDHPDPEMVTREVRHIMASHIPRAWTHPHVDCATILDHCSYNSQCQIKSTECAGCGSDNKCQADRDSGSADDLLESLGDGKHDSSHGFGRT